MPSAKVEHMRRRRCRQLTRPVEVPPRRHIIDNALDRKQNPLPFLTVERRKRLRCVGLVQESRRVGLGHPCVAVLELVGDRLRQRVRREDDPLDRVENVEEESGVHGCSKVESHRGRWQQSWMP